MLMKSKFNLSYFKKNICQFIPAGQPLEASELFHEIWPTLDELERRQFGKQFAAYVADGEFPEIQLVTGPRDSLGRHAKYQKIA